MSMSRTWVAASAAVVLIGATPGCRGDQGGGALHAQQASLEREVGGLRERVGKLERGEPILPEQAVVAAISDAVVRDFLTAQMPFDLEVQSFRISLTQAEAAFQGSPSVSLTGTIAHREHPGLVGEVRALGALDEIKVDPASGLLEAKVVVDHIDLLQMAGLEKYLSGATVDELARTVRKQLAGKIPTVQIPVKIEQRIDLPDVTDGPVRIQGATMPLKVGVADVFAGQGVLWVAIHVVPGDLVKKAPAAPVKEAPAKAAKAPAAAPAKGEKR
jgi:hypothetical protein